MYAEALVRKNSEKGNFPTFAPSSVGTSWDVPVGEERLLLSLRREGQVGGGQWGRLGEGSCDQEGPRD